MKSLTTLFSSLILSLALAGAAIAGETVNINTADAATIDRVLVNVGPAKADAIVAHRKANGAFRSAEQLALVKGIGLKTVEKNRDRIVVGAVRPAAAKGKLAAKPTPKQVARR
ncbi:MAG: helix-hairpin-helix domain-containing protein [Pseudomonadota bacterium]